MKVWLALGLAVVGMAVSGPLTSAFSVRQGLSDSVSATRSSGWNPENVQTLARGTFWEVRRSLAIITWNEAQVYFHRGFDLAAFTPRRDTVTSEALAHTHGEEGHEHQHEHEGEEGDSEIRIHTPEEEARIHSLEDHPFLHRSLLRPYIYEHSDLLTHGERMMPFYWLTTTLDPNFVRAYANGAYWLAFHFKRPNEALAYLEEGLQHNPGDYHLLATRAHIYFSKQHNYALAARYYEKSLKDNPANTREEKDDLIESLRYLARSYLLSNQPRQAIQTCLRAKQIDRLVFGFDTIMEEARKMLETGAVNHPVTAADTSTSQTRQTTEP